MAQPEKKEDFTEDASSVDNTDIEKQAREMGWKPESEWRGDPPKHGFVSAEDFVETGKTVLPVVSADNRRLKEQVADLTSTVASLKDGNARFKVFTDKARARDRKEFEDRLLTAEAVRAKAIDDSDGDAAVAAEREIRVIEKELDDIPDVEQRDPAVDSWIAENPWYSADPESRAVADGLSIQLRNERPDLIGRGHLDELKTRVQHAIPHKFENPNRETTSVEGARRTPRSTTVHTFANLPADAKREYEEFKISIPDFTKEEYVAEYGWDE